MLTTDSNTANGAIIDISYDGAWGPLRLDLRGNMWLGYNRTTAPTSSETHALFVTGKVGIGTSGPTGSVHLKDITDSNGADVFYVAQNTTSNRIAGYQVLDESGTVSLAMQYDNGGNAASIINQNNGSLAVYLGGSAAANALDDYEEGSGNSSQIDVKLGSTALTVTGEGFKYTKIGNIVNFQFEFRITDLNGASSGAFTVGLPFASVTGGYSAGALRIYAGTVDGNEFVHSSTNSSTLYLARRVDNAGTANVTATDGAYYFGQMTYTTS
jgi:hypothetical protein